MKRILKRSLLVGGVLGAVGLASVTSLALTSNNARAATPERQTLVERVADRFRLNTRDVQKVFYEDRAAHQAEHQAQAEQRLQTLVDNGTITTQQKTTIEAKIKEMRATREADQSRFADMTPAERQAKMEQDRATLQEWAKQQGIDLTKLQGILMGGGPHAGTGSSHGGFGGHHGMGMMGDRDNS